MRYNWIDDFLLAKKAVTKNTENWIRYQIGGKMFAAVPDDLLKDLLDKSYDLVQVGFSKKKQAEILTGVKG